MTDERPALQSFHDVVAVIGYTHVQTPQDFLPGDAWITMTTSGGEIVVVESVHPSAIPLYCDVKLTDGTVLNFGSRGISYMVLRPPVRVGDLVTITTNPKGEVGVVTDVRPKNGGALVRLEGATEAKGWGYNELAPLDRWQRILRDSV